MADSLTVWDLSWKYGLERVSNYLFSWKPTISGTPIAMPIPNGALPLFGTMLPNLPLPRPFLPAYLHVVIYAVGFFIAGWLFRSAGKLLSRRVVKLPGNYGLARQKGVTYLVEID